MMIFTWDRFFRHREQSEAIHLDPAGLDCFVGKPPRNDDSDL